MSLFSGSFQSFSFMQILDMNRPGLTFPPTNSPDMKSFRNLLKLNIEMWYFDIFKSCPKMYRFTMSPVKLLDVLLSSLPLELTLPTLPGDKFHTLQILQLQNLNAIRCECCNWIGFSRVPVASVPHRDTTCRPVWVQEIHHVLLRDRCPGLLCTPGMHGSPVVQNLPNL